MYLSPEEVEAFDIMDKQARERDASASGYAEAPDNLETPMKNSSIQKAVDCSATPATTIIPKRIVQPSKYMRGPYVKIKASLLRMSYTRKSNGLAEAGRHQRRILPFCKHSTIIF